MSSSQRQGLHGSCQPIVLDRQADVIAVSGLAPHGSDLDLEELTELLPNP